MTGIFTSVRVQLLLTLGPRIAQSVVTNLGAGWSEVRLPTRTRGVPPLQTVSENHPASRLEGIGVISGSKVVTNCQMEPRLGMSGAVPLLPLHAFSLFRRKSLCNLALCSGVYTSLLILTGFPEETANWLVTAVTWHRKFQGCQLTCFVQWHTVGNSDTQFITLASTRPALTPVIAMPCVVTSPA